MSQTGTASWAWNISFCATARQWEAYYGFTVSRADLAACMLTSLGDPATVHRHVAVAS